MTIEEKATTLLTRDNVKIFLRAWSIANPVRIVVCVQGLGGHGGYYDSLALHLAPGGTALVAPDLRGHGKSEGRRGDIDRFDHYLEDIHATINWAITTWPDRPLFLLGESMGSSIAIQYITQARKDLQPVPVAGLMLISPVLKAAINPTMNEVLLGMKALFFTPSKPMMPVTGREELGSRDMDFNDRLRADPLFVRKVSMRFLFSLTRWLKQARAKASQITLPLLVLQGKYDYVAHPTGTSSFLRRVASSDLHSIMFPEAYHSLLYDPDTPSVVNALTDWLTSHSLS